MCSGGQVTRRRCVDVARTAAVEWVNHFGRGDVEFIYKRRLGIDESIGLHVDNSFQGLDHLFMNVDQLMNDEK